MSPAKIYSAQISLLEAHIVEVEVDISRGLHAFSIVGLPDKAALEARDRIGAAIKHSGFTSPKQKNQKVVISLAPAERKKEGSGFDVAMSLGYLLATKDISFDPKKKVFLGELSLSGEIRPIRGTLLLVKEAQSRGFTEVYVPMENAIEAALIDGIAVYPVGTLSKLIDHLNTKKKDGGGRTVVKLIAQQKTKLTYSRPEQAIDMSDVRGQEAAKRGLEIAAAGGHNIALYGPPGTGKTLLARALCGLLPPLTFEETLEVTSIHSVTRTFAEHLISHPPFRSPHHTSSHVAIVGGGTIPKPGEVTLAHRGVLFLDELPEFDRRVIEALREPLEDRVVSISRARGHAQFPANFILIAALNPCPCGNFGSQKICRCSAMEIERYRKKLSGPLVDRIDMWIEVGHIDFDTLTKRKATANSNDVAKRVAAARKIQMNRFVTVTHIKLNSEMNVRELEKYVELLPEVKEILSRAINNLGLSPRSYHRVLKLARTIADLAHDPRVTKEHVLEALQYRPKAQNL